MRVFKAELRQALADPGRLPEGELDSAVEYTDENEAEFLRHLWRALYCGAIFREKIGVDRGSGESFVHYSTPN